MTITESNEREYDVAAASPVDNGPASQDLVDAAWALLGYRLVREHEDWTPEAEVLEREDVQDALAEGLAELRALKKKR